MKQYYSPEERLDIIIKLYCKGIGRLIQEEKEKEAQAVVKPEGGAEGQKSDRAAA